MSAPRPHAPSELEANHLGRLGSEVPTASIPIGVDSMAGAVPSDFQLTFPRSVRRETARPLKSGALNLTQPGNTEVCEEGFTTDLDK